MKGQGWKTIVVVEGRGERMWDDDVRNGEGWMSIYRGNDLQRF